MDEQQLLRTLMEVGHEVRARVLLEDHQLTLKDVYTLCFHIARELHGAHPDLRIMVGDRMSERGPIQHHWLELPSSGIFIDPAYDDLDPFQPVRVGKIADEEFISTYCNGLDSRFDVDDPRDRPEMVYKARTAFDPERGVE
jgi:hypothetical protein